MVATTHQNPMIDHELGGDHHSKRKPSDTNLRKSRSRDTHVQACSTAIAACCASATDFPVAWVARHKPATNSQ